MRVLLADGVLPNEAFLNDLQDYLGDDVRRPLTDHFSVAAPDPVNYDISFTYYIDPADAGNAKNIQAAVSNAVNGYTLWQKSKIGRDVVPDRLTAAVIQAGAKRVTIVSPTFTQVADTAVAVAGAVKATYGGIDSV